MLLFGLPCHAAQFRPLHVLKIDSTYVLQNSNYQYYIDKENSLGVDAIQAAFHNGRFQLNSVHFPVISNAGFTYWYRFEVRQQANANKKLFLEFYDPTIDSLDLYLYKGDELLANFKGGAAYPFIQKIIKHKNFVFPLPDGNTVHDLIIFMKVRSHKDSEINAIVRSTDEFIKYALTEYYIFGIFYGILLLMAIYNLVLFFSIRQNAYLYCVLYIISMGLFSMSQTGIAFEYLWPGHPDYNHYAKALAAYSIILWVVFYSNSFLKVKAAFPHIRAVFMGAIFLRTTLFLTGLFVYKPLLFSYNLDVLYFFICLCMGVRVYFKYGFKPARFFILGYTSLFIGFFISALLKYEMIKNTIATVYSIEIAVTLEMILLSFALADKYRVARQEKELEQRHKILQLIENEKLKDHVNRELENKVEERTKIIQQMTAELSLLNQNLTTENKELKVNVSQLNKAIVMSEGVDFTEFSKIYPDEETCFQYLANLKWKDGYACKKCEHSVYKKGKSPHSRKCASCYYEESAMANTLLQGLKFPITKAFYMLFLIYERKENITVQEISKAVDLREKTCWTFRRKILFAMKTNKKRSKAGDVNGWGHLVLIH
jgi:hypothetical protein